MQGQIFKTSLFIDFDRTRLYFTSFLTQIPSCCHYKDHIATPPGFKAAKLRSHFMVFGYHAGFAQFQKVATQSSTSGVMFYNLDAKVLKKKQNE